MTDRGNGVLDLDLSSTSLSDADISYIGAICSNSRNRWRSVHTLNFSDTAITDKAIQYMLLQDPFCPPSGISVLVLKGTAVSDEALKAFQDKYPDCEIQR